MKHTDGFKFNLHFKKQLKGETFPSKREVKCIHKSSIILGLTNICARFIDQTVCSHLDDWISEAGR